MRNNAVYFAHPMSDYKTLWEDMAEKEIHNVFKIQLINPSMPWHSKGWKSKGMKYFDEDILPGLTHVVFTPFPNGKIGSGVVWEVEAALKKGLQVYEMDRKFEWFKQVKRLPKTRKLTRTQTRAMLKKLGQR